MVWRTLFALLLLLAAAVPASAVSISGIMVYSADDFGSPSGFDTFDRPEAPQMHMWRTYALGIWHSLAVYEGLPPQSLTGRARPLNAGNFSVDIPLIDGENYFTIVGEPGPITATDTYQRFVVNLYFDGGLNAPGVSVLFPRYGSEGGSPTDANRSQYIYSFDVGLVQQRSPGVDDSGYDVYDDGFERVSVTGASFLPEDRFMSIDLVAGQRFGASGVSDFVGSLVVLVEPSEGGPAVGGLGGVGRGGVSTGGRNPRGSLPGGAGTVGGAPYVPSYTGPDAQRFVDGGGELAEPSAQGRRADTIDDDPWVSGGDGSDDEDEFDATPTPRDVVSAFRNWIGAAEEETPGTDSDAGDASERAAGNETPTPDSERAPAHGARTPTPGATRMPVTVQPKRTTTADTSGSPTPGSSLTPESSPTISPTPTKAATSASITQTPAPVPTAAVTSKPS